MLSEAIVAVAVFTLTVSLLSAGVMLARRALLPATPVKVLLNRQPLTLTNGDNLLQALLQKSILVPAACGGRGLCGQCKVTLANTDLPPQTTEQGHLSQREIRAGVRLACMHRVRPGLEVRVADQYLHVRPIRCRVGSARWVSALLREVRLELPTPRAMAFTPGQYVMVDVPAYSLRFADFDVDETFRSLWQMEGLDALTSASAVPARRAYSLANAPGDGRTIELLVRLALPPPQARRTVPPGVVSSYLCSLRAGDPLDVAGPYGDFRLHDSSRDKVLVAGGAGMAPMRAILQQELAHPTSDCRLLFCYGARSLRDLCYRDEFETLAAQHERFEWHVALSEPAPGSAWHGATGFVHTLLRDRVLKAHPAPETLEYYLCGPPLMSAAVIGLLRDYGVDSEQIFNDDFGN